MNFEPDQSILAIKQAIQDKEGIFVDQIKLIYSGKRLEDQATLAESNLQAGSIIHMVIQLRGGCF